MKNIVIGVFVVAIAVISVVAIKHSGKQDENFVADSDYIACSELCQKDLFNSCDRVRGNLDNCEENCERWTPSMKACIKKADNCDQIDLDFTRTKDDLFREDHGSVLTEEDKISQKSHCTIIDDDYSGVIKEEQKEVQYSCSGACYKYKQCAGFGKGVSEKDKNDAYDTCFEECQNWSKKTLACMEKVKINSPVDCSPLTMCGLAEYKNFIGK